MSPSRTARVLRDARSDPTLGSEDAIQAALSAAGVDPTRRAETLSPEEFAAIEHALPIALEP